MIRRATTSLGSFARAGLLGLAIATAVGTSGCSTLFGSGAAPPPSDPDPLERTYVIGPEDMLRVTVWRNPELSVDVPVRPDGKISVPLVDDVQAAGLTAEELKDVLTDELAEFVANPEVTVIVTNIGSKRIYLVGGLARQTTIPLNQDLRVLDAIVIGGGFTPFADRKNIRVLRRTPDGMVEYEFDYQAFVRGKLPLEANFLLQPGDTVVVPD